MAGHPSPPVEPLATFSLQERRAALSFLETVCDASFERTAAHSVEERPACGPAALARMAYCHNLEPLLHRFVADRLLTAPSAALAQRWETAYFESLARNNVLLDALARLLEATEKVSVEVLVLKGLVTAARAYGDLSLRSMSDIDLLCRPADLRLFCRAAGELGYRAAPDDSAHHLKLSRADGRVLVELHFDVYGVIATSEAFLSRAFSSRQGTEVEGVHLPALSRSMELVFSLAHLIHHDFKANLRGYLDIARLIAADPGPPAALEDELRRADLRPEWDQLLGLLGERFESFDAGVAAAAPPELLDLVEGRLLEIDAFDEEPPLGELRARRWRSRLSYGWRLLFPPQTRFEALAELVSADQPRPCRWRHVGWVVRGVLARLGRRRRGATPAASLSVKRRLYQRR